MEGAQAFARLRIGHGGQSFRIGTGGERGSSRGGPSASPTESRDPTVNRMSLTGTLSPTVSRILPIIVLLLIRSSCAHAWFRTTTVRTPFRSDRGVAFRETRGR